VIQKEENRKRKGTLPIDLAKERKSGNSERLKVGEAQALPIQEKFAKKKHRNKNVMS